MNSASTILVAGSANLDFVVRAEHIPAPGETVLGRGFETFPGGKGANQAIACARAGGVATRMLLALGDDALAVPLEKSLRDAGVQLHIVRSTGIPSGAAFICVADSAQNAITVAPGANAMLRPDHLPSLAGVSHLLLQLEIPVDTVLAYALAARARGVVVVLNAAPAQGLPAALLATVDILIVNEGELAVLAGPTASVDEGIAHLAVPNVIVTLGERGCRARTPQGWLWQAAYLVQPLDTTAAGDTFCGVLAAALHQGRAMPDALALASAAAAIACTRAGAQASIPSRAEVEAFMQANVQANVRANVQANVQAKS